jgi:Phage integrase family
MNPARDVASQVQQGAGLHGCLGHTFASQMVMRGAGLKEVQEILGHKTMSMTLPYAPLRQEHKKKTVNLLNGLTASSNPADLSCHKVRLEFLPNRFESSQNPVWVWRIAGLRDLMPCGLILVLFTHV